MSDSLLNLLEVLNEVLEEQGLQEQESGGGNETLEEIKNDIYKLLGLYLKTYVFSPISEILEKTEKIELWTTEAIKNNRKSPNYQQKKMRLGKQGIPVKRVADKIRDFSAKTKNYNISKKELEKIVYDHFQVKVERALISDKRGQRPQIFIVDHTPPDEQAVININRAGFNWDNLMKFTSSMAGSNRATTDIKNSIRSIISKFKIFFNEILFLNIQEEGSYRLENQLKIALIKYTAIQTKLTHTFGDIFRDIRLNGMAYTDDRKKYKTFIVSMLDYLSEGKAFYGTITLIPKKLETSEIEPIYSNFYTIDNSLFTYMKDQCLSGSIYIFSTLHDQATRFQENDRLSEWSKSVLQKIVSTLQEVANEYYTKPQKLAKHPDVIPDIIYNLLYSTNEEIKKLGVTLKEKFSELRHEPKEAPTITNPLIDTSGGKLSSKFETVLDVFMEGATGFEERIDIFTQKMKIFTPDYEPIRGNNRKLNNVLQTMNSRDFFSRVMVLDYINKLTKQFDAGTAGILFEYFLAQLVGGEQVGETGGAVDFRLGNKLGSAKMLSPSSQPVQSLENLQALRDKEITYVVGRKRKSGLEPIRMLPTSYRKEKKNRRKEQKTEKTEIFKIDLYVFKLKWVEGLEFNIAGTSVNLTKKDKTTVYLPHPEDIQGAYKGTIQIMSVSKEGIQSYREMLGKKLDDKKDDLLSQKKKLLDIVQNIFDNLKEGDTSANKYILTGDLSDGVTAITKLESATTGINKLMGVEEYSKFKDDPNDA